MGKIFLSDKCAHVWPFNFHIRKISHPWKPHDNLDDLGLASAADENAISTTSSLVVNAIHEVAGDPSAIGYAERTFVHVKRQAHHFGEISCANLGKHLLTSSPAKTRKSP